MSWLIVVFSAAVAALAVTVEPQFVLNESKCRTVDGKEVMTSGGGVLRVGEHYYWMEENRRDDGRFSAVLMYRSRDLRTWESGRTF